MRMGRPWVWLLVGVVSGVLACCLFLGSWPIRGVPAGPLSEMLDELALRFSRLTRVTREYPYVSIGMKGAEPSWNVALMGQNDGTNKQGVQQFIVKWSNLSQRLKNPDDEKVIVLGISPSVGFQLFSDAVDVIRESGYDYIWVKDIGLLRIEPSSTSDK